MFLPFTILLSSSRDRMGKELGPAQKLLSLPTSPTLGSHTHHPAESYQTLGAAEPTYSCTLPRGFRQVL